MPSLCRRYCAAFVIASLWPSCGLAIGEEASEDRLESQVKGHLNKALSRYGSVTLIATIRTRVIGSSDADLIVESTVLEVTRLGGKARVSLKSSSERSGRKASPIQNDILIYTNGEVLTCQAALDSSLRQVEGVTDDLGFILYSKRLAGTQRLDAQSAYNNLNDAGAVLWLIGYASLEDYMNGASDLRATSTNEGAEIRAASNYGDLSLTLSKRHGWLPRSIRVVKKPGHRTVGGLVRDVYGNGDTAAPAVKAVTWVANIDDFNADSAGRWAPKRISVSRDTMSNSGSLGRVETAIDLELVDFDPKPLEGEFSTDIVAPVGFPVTLSDASHLPFKWDGNAAVPGVPINAEKMIERLAETGSGKRNLLIGINVVLVLALLFLLWRKRAIA
ncbi:MAG: hypothetical protein ACT4QE_05170 [Anaerolineales bacterium]